MSVHDDVYFQNFLIDSLIVTLLQFNFLAFSFFFVEFIFLSRFN